MNNNPAVAAALATWKTDAGGLTDDECVALDAIGVGAIARAARCEAVFRKAAAKSATSKPAKGLTTDGISAVMYAIVDGAVAPLRAKDAAFEDRLVALEAEREARRPVHDDDRVPR